LESEGLLVVTPHVGTSVSKVDPDETLEFYLMRIELESLAAGESLVDGN
jgi:DNA-binding GntR family transcriptional regulator